jgi:hypothetical protein
MNDTTKAAAEVDALMKLAERLRMAPLCGSKYRATHAELESAIEAAIERARAEALMQAIQRLNANPYSLTKAECIDEIRAIRALGTTMINGLTQAETDASASCAGLSAGTEEGERP